MYGMLLTYNLHIRNTDPHFHLVVCYKKHFLGLKRKMLFLICGMLLYSINWVICVTIIFVMSQQFLIELHVAPTWQATKSEQMFKEHSII